MEKRLVKDPYLAIEYRKFMAEYLAFGHMEVVPTNETEIKSYYLPHHAVIKSNMVQCKASLVFPLMIYCHSGQPPNLNFFQYCCVFVCIDMSLPEIKKNV